MPRFGVKEDVLDRGCCVLERPNPKPRHKGITLRCNYPSVTKAAAESCGSRFFAIAGQPIEVTTMDNAPPFKSITPGFSTVTGDPVLLHTVCDADGNIISQETIPVSLTSNFTPSRDQIDVEIQDDHSFITNVDPADANYGLSLELTRKDVSTNGVTVTTYCLVEDVAGIGSRGDDVTALAEGGDPWSFPNDEEQLVIYPNVNFAVTGASTPFSAARVPIAGWMRAELEVGDSDASGVIYTTDGTAPTTTPLNGQLAQEGGVIILSEDEIVNAQFAPVDGQGELDPALMIELSFEQRNRAPETGQ